jgi:hypothetical protein
MLDPYLLNAQTCRQEEVLDIDADFPHNYFEYFIADDKVPFPGDAAAVLPRRGNIRLASQRGLFTLHNSREPLENRYSNCLRKFELRADSAAAAKRFLRLAGTDEYSLFPDLDGLCRHLKGRYEYLSTTRAQLWSTADRNLASKSR